MVVLQEKMAAGRVCAEFGHSVQSELMGVAAVRGSLLWEDDVIVWRRDVEITLGLN